MSGLSITEYSSSMVPFYTLYCSFHIASPAKRFATTQAVPSSQAQQSTTATARNNDDDDDDPNGSVAQGKLLEDVERDLHSVEQSYRKLITSRHVLSEESVIGFLKECEKLVSVVMSAKFITAAASSSEQSVGRKAKVQTMRRQQLHHQQQQQQQRHLRGAVTSKLLDLDSERTPVRDHQRPEPLTLAKDTRPAMQVKVINRVSPMLNSMLRDSKVFISEDVLRLYTHLQCEMRQAEHFPEIFRLFATKPVPIQQSDRAKAVTGPSSNSNSNSSSSSSGDPSKSTTGTTTTTTNTTTTTTMTTNIKYTPNSPDAAKSAIPADLAQRALSLAIEQRNLSLSLAIIDTTFCTTAYRRSKMIRHAGLPALLALSAPPGAYIAGKYAATFTVAMDPNTATWIAFSAVLAYLTFTGAIGFVAIATANDEMERVVWVPGTPLRERWVREEERKALDRIACAWGFKDVVRRGEEV
ncbi:hypothetical protein KEM54_003777 [Ascosphaera aggregata]|nr:hypothetical protein KEM54_003777 [Ascosphaera aggregata]